MPLRLILKVGRDRITLFNIFELLPLQIGARDTYRFFWPFDEGYLANLHRCLDVAATQTPAGSDYEPVYEAAEKLRSCFLDSDPNFRGLFASAQAKAAQFGGLHILLHLDPDVAPAPWEYMNTTVTEEGGARSRRFMRIEEDVSLVRVARLGDRPALAPVGNQIAVLLVCIPAGPNWPAVDIAAVRDSVLQAADPARVRVDVVDDASPTLDSLHEKLASNRYEIVHIVGHGSYEPMPTEGVAQTSQASAIMGWSGDGQYVSLDPAQVAGILRTLPPSPGSSAQERSLRLVVLTNCASARSLSFDGFTGVASRLCEAAPAVIAMQAGIGRPVALQLAAGLYRHLAAAPSDQDVELTPAFDTALRAMLADPAAWRQAGIPVLYRQTQDEVVFDRTAWGRSRPAPAPHGPSREWLGDLVTAMQLGDHDTVLSTINQNLASVGDTQRVNELLRITTTALHGRLKRGTDCAATTYRDQLVSHLRELRERRRWAHIAEYRPDTEFLAATDRPVGAEAESILAEAERRAADQRDVETLFERARSQHQQRRWQEVLETCAELGARDPSFRAPERDSMADDARAALDNMATARARLGPLIEAGDWHAIALIGQTLVRREMPHDLAPDLRDPIAAAAKRLEAEMRLPASLRQALNAGTAEDWRALVETCQEVLAADADHPIAATLLETATRNRDEAIIVGQIANQIELL